SARLEPSTDRLRFRLNAYWPLRCGAWLSATAITHISGSSSRVAARHAFGRIERRPKAAYFIIGQHPAASALFRFGPGHARHDRRLEFVIAQRPPVEGLSDVRKHAIGRDRPGPILNVV